MGIRIDICWSDPLRGSRDDMESVRVCLCARAHVHRIYKIIDGI